MRPSNDEDEIRKTNLEMFCEWCPELSWEAWTRKL